MKQPRREFIEKAAGVSALLAAGAGRLKAQSQRGVGIPTPRAKTLMSLFNLNYPIFEAAHGVRVTCPELAIAVANAGAMGALAITGWPQEKALDAVSRVRAATKGSFFVNYILGQEPASLKAVLDAGARVVQFSWGVPTKGAVSAIRAAGAKMGMQITGAESARAALDVGADYLVCQGTEAGGHVQATRGLYESLPLVLEEAKQIPVIASGGIGDGQGIRKALLAGAWGAMLGTRFLATVESNAHPAFKQAVIAAHARDTALTLCFQDGWPATHRALRNRTFVMWDAAGCPSPGNRPGKGVGCGGRAEPSYGTASRVTGGGNLHCSFRS